MLKMGDLHYCSLRGWEKSCIFADLICFDKKKMKNGKKSKAQAGRRSGLTRVRMRVRTQARAWVRSHVRTRARVWVRSRVRTRARTWVRTREHSKWKKKKSKTTMRERRFIFS